jgi:hypothetical protein
MIRSPKYNKIPKSGELRVYNIINVPNEATFYPVKDIKHATTLINSLADSQLLDTSIESNVFGLEVFEDGEWLEWESEDGQDIENWAANNLPDGEE